MAVPLSKSELDFALQALRVENVRVDGRALTAYRRLGIRFGAAHGEVEVNFGPTRALAVCSGEITPPTVNRPREGRISFHVEFGPLASPSFEVGRPTPQAVSVGNFVERLLRGSRAVDAEALCIVSGQKVWSIRVDVRALDDDGNLSDVCAIAALCSLLHFRKADVQVTGESAQEFQVEERAPVPLNIHHLPVPVTFALFPGKENEPAWVLDPNRLEEAAMAGSLCLAVNQHGELCGVHKPGGLPVDLSMVQHCLELAVAKAKEITGRINSELEADQAKRQEAKKNVHQRFAEDSLLTVQWDGSAPAEEAAEPQPVPLPSRPAVPTVRPAPRPAAPAASPAQPTAPAQPAAPPAQPAAPPARPVARPAAPPVPEPRAPEVQEPTPEPQKPRNRWKRRRAAEEPAPVQEAEGQKTDELAAFEDDGRDLDAELLAVAEEAAELEAQLQQAQSELEGEEWAMESSLEGSQEPSASPSAKSVVKKRKKKRPST